MTAHGIQPTTIGQIYCQSWNGGDNRFRFKWFDNRGNKLYSKLFHSDDLGWSTYDDAALAARQVGIKQCMPDPRATDENGSTIRDRIKVRK